MSLRDDISLRTLIEQMPRPAWASGGEKMGRDTIARSLAEGGTIAHLYALVAAPWTVPGLMLDGAGKSDFVGELPDAISLDIYQVAGGALKGRLVADLPAGDHAVWKEQAPSVLPKVLRAVGLTGSIEVAVEERGGRSVVTVSIGGPAEVPSEGARRKADAGVEAHIDLPRLLGELPLPVALPGIGPLDVRVRMDGACLAARLRVAAARDADGAPALEPVVTARDAGPLPAQDSAGKVCLRKVPWIVSRAFDGLASVGPGRRAELLAAGAEQLASSFECARKDPTASALADEAEAGWSLVVARFAEQAGDRRQAVKWAERACKLGREQGCVLAKASVVPYPDGSLLLPKVAWPEGDQAHPPDVRVDRSNEGTYVDGTRLEADPSGSEARMLIAGLHESLGRARSEGRARAIRDGGEAAELRVELQVDGRTPYRELARLLYTVGQAEGAATLVLSGRDGTRRWLAPTFPKMRAERATLQHEGPRPGLLEALSGSARPGLEGAFGAKDSDGAKDDPERAERHRWLLRKVREHTAFDVLSVGGPTPPTEETEEPESPDGGEHPRPPRGTLRAIDLDGGPSQISLTVTPDELVLRIVGGDGEPVRIPRGSGASGQQLVALAHAVQDAERALDLRPLVIVAADPSIPWTDVAEIVSVLAVPPEARFADVEELRDVIEGRSGPTSLPSVVFAVTD